MNDIFEEIVLTDVSSSAILRYEKTFVDVNGNEVVTPMLKISLRKGDVFYLTEESLYRMVKHLDILPKVEIKNDWEKIATELVKDYSNSFLLEQAKYCTLLSGWGIIAEICKRFAKISQLDGRRQV